jgi:predicted permease
VRSLWQGIGHRSDVEREMREEFRHHIEMRTDDLVRQGVPRAEAARRAHLEFGHAETHREAARASRGLRWVDQVRFSWIDVKLGLRMMVKNPGLTLVAVFALAAGIPTGLAPMHLARALERPLPEDAGNRVRAIRFWDPVSGVMALPTYGDFTLYSPELDAFDLVGAYRSSTYNVASEDGRAAPVQGAEVTASIFAILGAAPRLGRILDTGDEEPGSADVVLLGHDVWAARFARDPDIVGSTVRVGSRPHIVVGVMPDGFRFPLNDQVWVPLRRESTVGAGEGRTVRIVGRLADGVSTEEAQAELLTVALPPTHRAVRGAAALQPEVVPFAYTYMGLPRGGMGALPEYHFIQLLGLVLLLVACANVAMLIFARTATRFREIAVRTALGASRWRIVSQVFIETLLLASIAAGLGVLAVDRAIDRIPWQRLAGEAALPYWLDLGVPAAVLPWAFVLALVSATVAGVAPALRITRKDVRADLRAAEAGRSGIRFGGITGGLIVADVAVAVGVIAFSVGIGRYLGDLAGSATTEGIPAAEYLAVELRLSANELEVARGERSGGGVERFATLQQTLAARLEAEPDVRGVVFADALPRMNHRSRPVEIDGEQDPDDRGGRWVRVARVDVDFFDALEQPVLTGRDFDRVDAEGPERPVIVNTVFVEEVLGGVEPLGRRVRFTTGGSDSDTTWHEIVGVVGHLGMNTASRAGDPGVYLPEPPGGIHPVQVGIRVGPDPERFVPRLREVVAEADPTAILGTPVVLSRVQQGDWYVAIGMVAGLGLLVAILVALAASGMYAIMSFSVAERTREIGIRTALGASRRELVLTIMRRSLGQLGLGALLGIPLATWLLLQIEADAAGASATGTSFLTAIALASGVVGLIGLLSCVAPTRRALRIEANEALRAEN